MAAPDFPGGIAFPVMPDRDETYNLARVGPSSAESSPSKKRRQRVKWEEHEVQALEDGVQQYGVGNWSIILREQLKRGLFSKDRTASDLKDKWRNLHHAVLPSDREIRRFVLLDSNYNPIISKSNNPRIMRNRIPRDAALKAASKDEFYPDGANETTIYLQEYTSQSERNLRYRMARVHVFRGWRIRRNVENSLSLPLKFQKITSYWESRVEKLREEHHILDSETRRPAVPRTERPVAAATAATLSASVSTISTNSAVPTPSPMSPLPAVPSSIAPRSTELMGHVVFNEEGESVTLPPLGSLVPAVYRPAQGSLIGALPLDDYESDDSNDSQSHFFAAYASEATTMAQHQSEPERDSLELQQLPLEDEDFYESEEGEYVGSSADEQADFAAYHEDHLLDPSSQPAEAFNDAHSFSLMDYFRTSGRASGASA